MKKRTVRISVLSIAFFVMFLVISSGTRAETQDGAKNTLASELNLEAASIFGQKSISGETKDRDIAAPPALFVPVKEGFRAFLGFPSRPHSGFNLVPKDMRTDYRAVVGLHFSLR